MNREEYDNKIRHEVREENKAKRISNKEAQPKLREYMANQAKKRALLKMKH